MTSSQSAYKENSHVNMPLVASTGPALVRCWQHRPSTGPVLAHNGMFMGSEYGVVTGYSNKDHPRDTQDTVYIMSVCVYRYDIQYGDLWDAMI